MNDDRDRARRIVSTMPGAIESEPAQLDESADGSYAEVEPIEDTVPYLPLKSYPVQIWITHIGPGEPHIYPDELLDDDE